MPTGRLGGTLVSIELVRYPDVFLRKVSKDVAFPLDDKINRLITWMTRAMYQHNGIGLAAIQVGYDVRMFVMDCTSVLVAAAKAFSSAWVICSTSLMSRHSAPAAIVHPCEL